MCRCLHNPCLRRQGKPGAVRWPLEAVIIVAYIRMRFLRNLSITESSSPVKAVLAGHVHFYNRDMINENIVQIVGDAGYKGSAMWIKIVPVGNT